MKTQGVKVTPFRLAGLAFLFVVMGIYLLVEVVEILAVKVDYQLFQGTGFFLVTFFYNLKEALILILLV